MMNVTDTSKVHDFPPLTPITSEWMHQLMSDQKHVHQLLEEYGSPLNIHHLPSFANNYAHYAALLDQYGLKHCIQFARKANKCAAFVRKAHELKFGVDTASYHELKQCIDMGVPVNQIIVTAAIKEQRLLRLALEYGVLIIMDNHDECEQLQRLALAMDLEAFVGVRLSGFYFEGEKLVSRFGYDIDGAFDYITTHFGTDKTFDRLHFRGLHFHLNGYSTAQRGTAMHQCVDLAQRLQPEGYKVSFIDIGGGLLMNYLESEEEWLRFQRSLKEAVQGHRSPVTYLNNGLGYFMQDNELLGNRKTYPYYNGTPKAVFLKEVLESTDANGKTVVSRLLEHDIQFRMEPGRSMLDQCGMTVARVAFRKQDAQGNWLVGLEMNMTQMHSSSADFLLDPFVLYNYEATPEDQSVGVNFTGAYCLERDVLLKRTIALPKLPQIGDLVIFVNTAGYMMHFFESEAHLFELAKNVVIDDDPLTGERTIALDQVINAG